MAQALADILASLDPVYNPQKQTVQKQIDALPGQEQAQQAGLDTAKTNAFNDINVQANDRGLSYSGMPIAEQARYTGATYLPAVAKLKADMFDRRSALEQTLQQLETDRTKQAYGIYDEQYRADQAREVAIQAEKARTDAAVRAARASNPGLSFGGGFSGGGVAAPAAAAAPSPQDHLMADIQRLIPADYATRFLPGYTERQIARLQAAYGDIAPGAVANAVYQYRKQVAGN